MIWGTTRYWSQGFGPNKDWAQGCGAPGRIQDKVVCANRDSAHVCWTTKNWAQWYGQQQGLSTKVYGPERLNISLWASLSLGIILWYPIKDWAQGFHTQIKSNQIWFKSGNVCFNEKEIIKKLFTW